MGPQDKMELLLVAALLHTACTLCKPQPLRENPFNRYVGKHVNSKVNLNSIQNYNTLWDAFTNPSINKGFKYPDVNFPSDTSDKMPNVYNSMTNAIHKSRNIKYDPALLESFKKEARRKRKSKKQVNENIASSKPILLPDSQTYVTDMGTFPEVEYPLSAMDTWMPKYWNPLAFGADESFTNQNDFMFKTQPANSSKFYPFKIYSNAKRNKGLISFKKSKENRNSEVKTLNHSREINSKTVVPPGRETKKNDKNLKDTIYLSQCNLRRKPKKRIMTQSTQKKLTKDRKVLPKILTSNQPSNQSDTVLTFTSFDLDNETLTCSQEKNNNDVGIHTTKTSNKSVDSNNTGTADDDTNIDNYDKIDENLISSKILSNNNQFNIFNCSPQTKLVSGECPNDDIRNSQIQNNVSILYDTIFSNVTHESLIEPKEFDEFQISENVQPEHNPTYVVRLTNYTGRLTNLVHSQPKINNKNTVLPVDKLKPYNISLNESSALKAEKLRDFAENVMAKVGAVPKKYDLPPEFVLEQLDASYLPTDYNYSLDVTLSPYNHNRRDIHHIQSDITNLYNIVENALAQIELQQEKIHLSNDVISEIISGIDSLPTEYIVPDHPALYYDISDTIEYKPTEYILPDPIELDYTSKINEHLRQMTYINYNDDLLPDKSTKQVSSTYDSLNDFHPVCPIPAIDQCFISYLPQSELFQNNMSTTPLMEIYNGGDFARMKEYSEHPIKEKDTPNKLIDNFKEHHSENKISQDGEMCILMDMPGTMIFQSDLPRTNSFSTFDALADTMLPERYNTTHTQPSSDVKVQVESFKGMPESFSADKTTDSDIILKPQKAFAIDGVPDLCDCDLLPETFAIKAITLSDTDNQAELLDANISLIPQVSNNRLREVSSKLLDIDLVTIIKTNDYVYEAESSQQTPTHNKAIPITIATENILGSPEADLFVETLASYPIATIQQETFALDESAEAKTTEGIPTITDAIIIPKSRVIDSTQLSHDTNILSKALSTYEILPASLGENVSLEPFASAKLLASPDSINSAETTTDHDFSLTHTQDYVIVPENLTQVQTKLLSDKVLLDMITTDNSSDTSNADMFPETPASNVTAISFNTDVEPETLGNNDETLSHGTDVSSKSMGSIGDTPAITETSIIPKTQIIENLPPWPDTEVFSEAQATNDLPVTSGENVLLMPLDGEMTKYHDRPVINESETNTDLPFTYKIQMYTDLSKNPPHTPFELLVGKIFPDIIDSNNISTSSEAELFSNILATDATATLSSTDTQSEIPNVKDKTPSRDADIAPDATVTEDKPTLSDALIFTKKRDTINRPSSFDPDILPGTLVTDDLQIMSDVNVLLKPLSTDNLLVSCDAYILPGTVTTDNKPVIPESDIETNLFDTDNTQNCFYVSVPTNQPQARILADKTLPDVIVSDNKPFSLETELFLETLTTENVTKLNDTNAQPETHGINDISYAPDLFGETIATEDVPAITDAIIIPKFLVTDRTSETDFSAELDTDGLINMPAANVLLDLLDIDHLLVSPDSHILQQTSSIAYDTRVIPESDIETDLHLANITQKYINVTENHPHKLTKPLFEEILSDMIASDNISASPVTLPITLATDALAAFSNNDTQPEMYEVENKLPPRHIDIIPTDNEDISTISEAFILIKKPISNNTSPSPGTNIFPEPINTLSATLGANNLPEPLAADNLQLLSEAVVLPQITISDDILMPGSDTLMDLPTTDTDIEVQNYTYAPESLLQVQQPVLSDEVFPEIIATDHIPVTSETESLPETTS